MQIVNKKAYHEYEIIDEYEAGIVLIGSEIKSIRNGKVNIKESYIEIRDYEAFIEGMHISPFENDALRRNDPYRRRKLLLSKREIVKLYSKVKTEGFTIVPLKVYINSRGYAKIKIALAKGKKIYDKRQSQKEKDDKRKIDRYLKNY